MYIDLMTDVLYHRLRSGEISKSEAARLKKCAKRLYYCTLEISRRE